METQTTKDYVFLLYNRENLSPGQKKMETQENSRKLRACGLEKTKCYAVRVVLQAVPSLMRSIRNALTAPPSSAMSATTAAADR